jgi:hypothetical protein
MRRSIAIAALLLLCLGTPVLADNPSQTFVGTLKWINLDKPTKQFGVHGSTARSGDVHTFYVDDNFQGVFTSMGGTKKKLSDLHVGMQVQVTYHKAAVFGSDRATKVTIVNGFAIPMAQPSTPASPSH